MKTHSVNEQKTDPLVVDADDIIEVSLDENPGTGFFWKISSINKDDITLIGEDEKSYSDAGIGGGREKIFKLKVLRKEKGQINFENSQKWSGDVYKTFNVSYS